MFVMITKNEIKCSKNCNVGKPVFLVFTKALDVEIWMCLLS